ncbi:MAG: hypothetical protein GXO32_05165 [Crenarchaeota archaeon]|nr:hypothetical protein [Thermoproteota archaeon]
MSVKPVVKISHMKTYWYIWIPKQIKELLEKSGVSDGSTVIWEDVRDESGSVVVTLRILKGVKAE